MYVWRDLALIYKSRVASGVIFAIYTCPPEALVMQQCVWISVSDLRSLHKKEAREGRVAAENFLLSVAGLFEADGSFHTQVSAAAAVLSSTRGYETLAKAKRTVCQKSTDLYVKTAIMIGRHVCGKPQDEDFGKAKAENLGDILARLRQLVREEFPDFGDADCLASIVVPVTPVPIVPPTQQGLVSSMAPPTAVPKRGVSAASVSEMLSMSTINSDGQRVGAFDRLTANKMQIGSKVIHGITKGVYEIKEAHSAGGVATVGLELLHKCVNMKQLWALQADGKGGASGKPMALQADSIGARSKAGPTRPPQSLASTGVSAAVGEVSAEDWSGASTAGSDTESEPEEFTLEKAVVLDAFLSDWHLELSPVLVDHSLNPEWPGGRMATNVKYQKMVVQGLVFQALWSLGCKIDRGISPGTVLQCTLRPSVGFYVS